MKKKLNWDFIEDYIHRDECLPLIMRNLLDGASEVTSFVSTEAKACGGIYALDKGGLLLLSSSFSGFTPQAYRAATPEVRIEQLTKLVDKTQFFSTFQEVFKLLRSFKQDNASYYEHGAVADPLIKYFYQHRLIKPDEVLA